MTVLFWGNCCSTATLETYTHSYPGLKWVYLEDGKKKGTLEVPLESYCTGN